jgi:hypothetical protein
MCFILLLFVCILVCPAWVAHAYLDFCDRLFKVTDFKKIQPVAAALIQADGQTERHDEANRRFSLFMWRPLTKFLSITSLHRHATPFRAISIGSYARPMWTFHALEHSSGTTWWYSKWLYCLIRKNLHEPKDPVAVFFNLLNKLMFTACSIFCKYDSGKLKQRRL